MATVILILAILSLLSGIGLIYWINRRKFYRRNVAGLEGFSSFEASLYIRFIERIGKWLAYALILFSLFLFYIHSLEKERIEDKKQKVAMENEALAP
ncbi:hypothetical protein [Myroides odoratus]|uniref:Molybdenum ABC transporter permease n=1 Tax=Myroides odoratus TaxID=256 RepID=A0A378RIR5_MYROD|nr:hypothetical protein [Myroides odoratus]QQU02169.1 hypothetical protein I6I89_09815 [Myroides odoratus]STZ26923.1 Uncharacterised protein [Myroides odoratus]